MASPSEEVARNLRKLAVLVRQRRVALGIGSTLKAGQRCGIADATYRKIESGLPVNPTTYDKLEIGFGFQPNSCQAVLDGADSITLADGTELIEGAQIVRFDSAALSEGIPDAVTKSAMLVAPELTGGQIREMNEQVLEILRKRGLLPQASE